MSVTRVSLHRSGRWRLAFTAASGRTASDGDRVLHRYEPPQELAVGWRRGATVIIPHSSLRAPYPEKLAGRKAVSWWGSSGAARALRFDVLLRDSTAGDLTVVIAGEVGRVTLDDGSGVWVVASDIPSTPEHERFLDELRGRVRDLTSRDGSSAGLLSLPHPAAMAWGFDNDDGVPILYDLGDPRPTTSGT